MDKLIEEWAEEQVNTIHRTGFYGINLVEQYIYEPGGGIKGHRVLWWPRNRRIAKMSRAAHQLDVISQVCLIVKYGGMLNEDGTKFTKHDLIKSSSLTLRRFNDITKKAKLKLLDIL